MLKIAPLFASDQLVVLIVASVILLAAAFLFLWLAMRANRKKRLIDDLPTCKTSGVFIGLVELKGTAESEQPLISYLTEQQSVWNSWDVQEEWRRTVTETYTDSDGNVRTRTRVESGWKTVGSGGEMQPFYLQDDTGYILVDPDEAKIEPLEVLNYYGGRSDDIYHAKGPFPTISDSTGRLRFRETILPLHHPLYLVGQSRLREDIVAPMIAKDELAPLFLISTQSEEQVRASRGVTSWVHTVLYFVFGLFATLCLVILLMQQQGQRMHESSKRSEVQGTEVHNISEPTILLGDELDAKFGEEWPMPEEDAAMQDLVFESEASWRSNELEPLPIAGFVALGLAPLFLVWIGCWAWSLYNSLVGLKNRASQAWSNIDVQLKRRFDLIGNLANVVEGFRKHEREVQETVALLRSQAHTMTASDRPQPCAAQLLMLQEHYPELKANALFLNLQENLSETENLIAFAREYYNESVEQYNTRCQRVPDCFFAKLAGMKSLPFFHAEKFERAAVKVKLA